MGRYIEDGIRFSSKFEKEVYLRLKQWGFPVRHQVRVGSCRFDFLVKKVFVEAHPFHPISKVNPYDRLAKGKYHSHRRNILDKHGYKDYKLLVVSDLREVPSSIPADGKEDARFGDSACGWDKGRGRATPCRTLRSV